MGMLVKLLYSTVTLSPPARPIGMHTLSLKSETKYD